MYDRWWIYMKEYETRLQVKFTKVVVGLKDWAQTVSNKYKMICLSKNIFVRHFDKSEMVNQGGQGMSQAPKT